MAAFTPDLHRRLLRSSGLAKGDSPYRSFAEVLAAARADPDKFNIGTIARGSTQNTAAELLRSATGVKMTIVAMRNTGEVATALLRGDVTVGIESYAALKGQIVEGALRADRQLRRQAIAVPAQRADPARERGEGRGDGLECAGGAGGHAG